MIRKTGWTFHGDFFDPEIPGCVDLHYRFWDPETERFDAPGISHFWERRMKQDGIPVLDGPDRLAYASLHMLRHLFRPALRPLHVYELAYFLETRSADDAFWARWRDLHPAPLRRLQAIAFRLAESWFGCSMAQAPAEEVERLHPDILLWFERYAASPIEAGFRPNKHELWLHLALLDSSRDRRDVFLRRVFPASLPGAVEPQHVPDDQVTLAMRVRRGVRYVTYVGERFLHHARSLPPIVAHGLIWKSPIWRLRAPFWAFLVCSTFVNCGGYLFLLLYNLYLLDLGYRENVLGLVASAFAAGNLAGVLPAAGLAHRVGLKKTLLVCIAGSAAVYLLRAILTGEPALLATAFASGLMFSIWAVYMSPVVAAVTSESARPSGFSITFGSGIALGVLAGVIGGRMPGWVAHGGFASSPAQAKRLVLFIASAFVLLALWPAMRLRLDSPGTARYPLLPLESFHPAILGSDRRVGLRSRPVQSTLQCVLRAPVPDAGGKDRNRLLRRTGYRSCRHDGRSLRAAPPRSDAWRPPPCNWPPLPRWHCWLRPTWRSSLRHFMPLSRVSEYVEQTGYLQLPDEPSSAGAAQRRLRPEFPGHVRRASAGRHRRRRHRHPLRLPAHARRGLHPRCNRRVAVLASTPGIAVAYASP